MGGYRGRIVISSDLGLEIRLGLVSWLVFRSDLGVDGVNGFDQNLVVELMLD